MFQPPQHSGESHFTNESPGLNQVKQPTAQTLCTMSLSDWRGSLTTFNGFTGTRPVLELVNATWEEISNLVRPEKPAAITDKRDGQYFVPCLLKDASLVGNTLEAAIKNGQPTIGKMRSKGHVTEATMLVTDIDGISRDAFYDTLIKIDNDGLTCIVYSTYSHGSEDKPGVRARMVVPVDQALATEAYRAAWHGFDQRYFGGAAGMADSSGANLYQQQGIWCCDPSRIDKAEKWGIDGGVASADALITIGNAILAAQAAQSCSAAKAARKSPAHIGTKQATSSVSNADYPSSDATKVADACQQIRLFRDTKGEDQSETLWRDCLGVVGYCEGGDDLCHDWSSGHSGYDERKTAEKLAYRLKTPPTTCAQFQKSNPNGCAGCRQKCNSPITLGWEDAFVVIEAPEVSGTTAHVAVESTTEEMPKVDTATVDIESTATDLTTVSSAPLTQPTDAEVIALLVAMPKLEYERVRIEQAKIMGCRPAALDDLVKAARKEESESVGNLPFPEIEPHSAPIDPAQLLTEISITIRRFIVLDAELADAAALWVAFTWFINAVEIAPLAIINAPEKACGKSQLLDLLGRMAARPISAANSSTAFMFRAVAMWTPTILIDEADTFIRDNDELKGLINAGYTRANAYVGRVVGDNHEPKLFKVWSAKALAGISLEKHLPDATMSRAIVFELRRKLPHEQVSRLREAEDGLFDGIASKLARFSDDYSQKVRLARPTLPDELNDRAQDNWQPLLAIAGCAGNEWIQRATAAALKLSGVGDRSASTGNELLADIKQIFEAKKTVRIKSVDLIAALCEDEECGWATYNRGKPLTPRQLGKQLAVYGISSKTVRLGDKNTPKGFDAAQFADAFARYLTAPEKLPQHRNAPPEPISGMAEGVADLPQHGTHDAPHGEVAATAPVADVAQQTAIRNDSVTLELSLILDCGGVADETPISGEATSASPDVSHEDAF